MLTLGPTRGVFRPGYQLIGYRDGHPRKPITGVDWRSATSIQTSKAIGDLSGTFAVSLKDGRFRHSVREMDVVRIKLRGHYSPSLQQVMTCVVDEVRPAGSADAHAGQDDVVISGRCVGKYLQVTSLFLPVWDPEAALPTALTFGFGDAAKKVGSNDPYSIFRYLIRRFTYGERKIAGASGIPNSRYWLDHFTRFSRHLGFQIPFLQFDETDMAQAFKRLEVLGFTEAWVDELGRVVYRQPGWNRPVDVLLPTGELRDHAFPRGDVEAATYVEVIPAGDPGIDSATAQSLRAGRAPVPSSYLNAGKTALAGNVSPEFVIDTNSKGEVTAKGRLNHWYKLQRRLGVRPQQISSPLLVTQAQAQAQAEGLLRFFGRATKTMQVTIPGCPEARLGTTWRAKGPLDGADFDRTFYAEQISHLYLETSQGGEYSTTVFGTHGRDPWDPGFKPMTLPKATAQQLAAEGGILDGSSLTDGGVDGQLGDVRTDPGNGTFLQQTTRPDGKRVLPTEALSHFLELLAGQMGSTVYTNTYSRHKQYADGGNQSKHWTGQGADLHVTSNWPSSYGTQLAFHAFRLCGVGLQEAAALAGGGGVYTTFEWTYKGQTYPVQILWGADVGHVNHVHVSVG